jgi:hypothetical protein
MVRAPGLALTLAAGLGLSLVLTPEASRAEGPLCRAEVVLAAPRAFVGEPVLHRVRIEQRREVVDMRWETSLSFPALRVELLLGAGGPPERSASHQTIEERRVLFPARAGRLALPAARIACESAGRVESAEVPAAELIAEEPPREGRPRGWEGLIGPVEVTSYATPDRVSLGESVSISVTVRGTTNVWAAPVQFAGAFSPDVAELFERPPELARDMGRTLVLRSYRSFDLVPRRAGRLEIPEVRIAYFDPTTRRYAEARAPAIPIEVAARSAPSAPGAAAEPAAAPSTRAEPPGWLAAAGLALGVGLAAGFWLGRRFRSRRHAAAGPVTRDERRVAHDTLHAALASGDATAAASAASRALRLALEPSLPGARTLAVEELAAGAPSGLEAAVALLGRLERARFDASDPAALLALAREAATRGR